LTDGIDKIIQEYQKDPIYHKWYLDDGGVIGSKELLLKIWEYIKTEGPRYGLHLKPIKQEACLSTKIGGLGLRRVIDHANVAFTASWHEAVTTSGEQGWTRPDSCDEKHQTQRAGSIAIDEIKFK